MITGVVRREPPFPIQGRGVEPSPLVIQTALSVRMALCTSPMGPHPEGARQNPVETFGSRLFGCLPRPSRGAGQLRIRKSKNKMYLVFANAREYYREILLRIRDGLLEKSHSQRSVAPLFIHILFSF